MSHALPEHASVVVIGGGIMGCSTLYHLSKLGVSDAILLDRAQIASGTTWHSAAQVRTLRHSRNLTRMIRYSAELYAGLEAETGQATGWIRNGSLSIATNPDRLTHIKRQEALAHAYGVPVQSISPEEAQDRWPLMNGSDVIGAVWSPEDGRVSPTDLCAALIKGAKSGGAQIHENTEVTGILSENGRIRAVETTRGTVRCDAIALCAGLWSRDLGAQAGCDVPVLPCEHFYLLTQPVAGLKQHVPTLSDHDSHLYIRDEGGGFLVGCFEPKAKAIAPGSLPEPFVFGLLPEDWDQFEPMMENALHRLPALEHAEVKMLLNGPESFTPDGTFMLGETSETRGLFLGCGMNSVGMAAGGGAGMNLAHAIVHGHTAYDLSDADAMRFSPAFNSLEHLMARAPEILGTHYEIAYPDRQRSSARQVRTLPLHQIHQEDGAVFGQSGPWERPLCFNGSVPLPATFDEPPWFETVRAEVMAAHRSAALFDLSSFGKIEVMGSDAEAFLMRVCAGHMNRAPGSVIYSAVLNARGTYEADLTAQRISADHYRLFVGTTTLRRDLSWLNRATDGFHVSLEDSTDHYATFALMGPDAAHIVTQCGAPELCKLGYFKVGPAHIADKHVRAARISYVGENGWEITCKTENAAPVYAALRAAGAQPAGLFAQTSMRIEKGFCAFGHELDRDIGPAGVGLAGLTRASGGFTGFDAMQGVKSANRLCSLKFADTQVRPIGHEPVYLNGTCVGQVTSAAFGFRVNTPVALALCDRAADGQTVQVDIARRFFDATVVKGPLFDPDGYRMRPNQ